MPGGDQSFWGRDAILPELGQVLAEWDHMRTLSW